MNITRIFSLFQPEPVCLLLPFLNQSHPKDIILFYSPPPYIAANIMEDTHAISLYDVPKKSWISLKKIAMLFGKAYENPMDMNAPNTTAHPHPPSGGVWARPVSAGGGISGLN